MVYIGIVDPHLLYADADVI